MVAFDNEEAEVGPGASRRRSMTTRNFVAGLSVSAPVDRQAGMGVQVRAAAEGNLACPRLCETPQQVAGARSKRKPRKFPRLFVSIGRGSGAPSGRFSLAALAHRSGAAGLACRRCLRHSIQRLMRLASPMRVSLPWESAAR